MDDRTSEASPFDLEVLVSATVPVEAEASSWSQMALFDHDSIVVVPKLIMAGPQGALTVSVTVLDFHTFKWLACEVRPGLRFPRDVALALAWIEERVLHYSGLVAPF